MGVLLQTVFDALVQKMASLKDLTENLMNAQQPQSVFGIEYGDTMAYIAIPLIIALFAFAFAYMFTVITRVHQKYDSEYISEMLKSSGTYRFYNGIAAGSVFYIFIYGVFAIIPSTRHLPLLMFTLSAVGLGAAFAYAFIVLRFVLSCLQYDNHYSLLGVIDKRYERNRKKKNERKKQRTFNNYLNRLIDLCKYSIRIRNNRLFELVLARVNEYGKTVKAITADYVIKIRRSFYGSIVKGFVQTPTRGEMERVLFRSWQQTLRHDELLSLDDYPSMLANVVEAVKLGQRHIFEAYAETCGLGYAYINEVADVKYIIGKDTKEQKRTDGERLKKGSELRETHFLAAAYLFSLGHFEVVNVFRKRVGSVHDSFFPMTLSEVLKLYADCKARQDKTGAYRFDYWPNYYNVLGNNYDKDILEKLTAMLVLMMSQPDMVGKEMIVSRNKMRLLSDSRNQIISFGNLWKSHEELGSRFPQIRNVDIEKRFDAGMSRLSDGTIKGSKSLFELSLAPAAENRVQVLFDSYFAAGKSNITDTLEGNYNKNKTETIPLGTYTFLVDKPSLLIPDSWNDLVAHSDLTRVFKRRYVYAVYEALSEMSITDIKTKRDRFEKQFLRIVGDRGGDYVIINTGYHSIEDFQFDNADDSRSKTFSGYYKGAPYFDAEKILPYGLIRDLPKLSPFANTILVINKKALPTLEVSSNGKKPGVTCHDESNKDKGRAYVRITVDPHRSIRYCKKSTDIHRFHFKD